MIISQKQATETRCTCTHVWKKLSNSTCNDVNFTWPSNLCKNCWIWDKTNIRILNLIGQFSHFAEFPHNIITMSLIHSLPSLPAATFFTPGYNESLTHQSKHEQAFYLHNVLTLSKCNQATKLAICTSK